MKSLILKGTKDFFKYAPLANKDGRFQLPLNTGRLYQDINPIQECGTKLLHNGYDPSLETDSWHKECDLTVNNYGYRCDDFTANHEGIHILFAGCSVTFPHGLRQDEGWAWKTYEKIKNKNPEINLSGFFNLSFPGWSVLEIIFNITKYINTFGKPDFIFINWPNLTRFYGVSAELLEAGIEITLASTNEPSTMAKKSNELPDYNMNPAAKMLIKYLTYNNIKMLEQFCSLANIKLKSFSWNNYDEDSFNSWASEMDFDSYESINFKDQQKRMFEISKSQKRTNISYVAKDKTHPGTLFQEMWSNVAIEFFERENENTRV